MNAYALFHRPFMIYGFWNAHTRQFKKLTRISSTATILSKKNANIGDGVWVWHHSIVDGTGGVTIGDYCQIGAWVGIFSHSSHLSVRLMGAQYINTTVKNRIGYVLKPVIIGDYTFIGAHAMILPGVSIGKGCLISAGSVVSSDVPDYSIAKGAPAKVVGSVFDMDKEFKDVDGIENMYFNWKKLVQHLEKVEK
jgi:acetyltransferase-like isoleucine patch superfamily enzyme